MRVSMSLTRPATTLPPPPPPPPPPPLFTAESNGEGRVVAEAGRVVVAVVVAAVVMGRVSADRGRCLCGLVTTMIRSSVSEQQHQHQQDHQQEPTTKTTNNRDNKKNNISTTTITTATTTTTTAAHRMYLQFSTILSKTVHLPTSCCRQVTTQWNVLPSCLANGGEWSSLRWWLGILWVCPSWTCA